MDIGIIQFPGSNCERETELAVKRAGMNPVPFLWNQSLPRLNTMQGYVIVGGFSYEDRGRAGVVAASSPIMQIIREESEKGKPVLGICNGAQILVETGLVPGTDNYGLHAALTENKRVKQGQIQGTGFYNDWCHLKLRGSKPNAFTRLMDINQPVKMPFAHAQGRFVLSEEVEQIVRKGQLTTLQYCDETGQIHKEFPTNPNGSAHNIAALSNFKGNVLAIMPHPERDREGDVFFQSMKEYIASHDTVTDDTYQAKNTLANPLAYKPLSAAHSMIVELIITDNEAFTLQNMVNHLGFPIQLQRKVLWEIQCDSKSILHQVQASGVLFNNQKEFVTTLAEHPIQKNLLVHPKEDIISQEKLQQLNHHFDIQGIKALRRGILWQIQAQDNSALEHSVNQLLKKNVFYNPISHQGFWYV